MNTHPLFGKVGCARENTGRMRKVHEYGVIVGTILRLDGDFNVKLLCADGMEMSIAPREFEQCAPEEEESIRELLRTFLKKRVHDAIRAYEEIDRLFS